MSHASTSVGQLVLAILGTGVICAYMLIFSFLALVFLRNTLTQTDNFYLRVRMPSVMMLEIVQLWAIVVTVCLREGALLWQCALPCWVQDLSFCVTLAAYMIIWPMRQAQLVYVFDPNWRKWHHRHFTRFKLVGLTLVVMVLPLLYLALQMGWIHGCLHICGQPGCAWGSRWLMMVGYVPIWWLFSLPLMIKLVTIRVEEKLGLMADFNKMSRFNVPCIVGSYLLIIAVDFGALPPEPWYTVSSILIVLVPAFILFYCHIKPAFVHGYAPPFLTREGGEGREPQPNMTFTQLLQLGQQRRQQRAIDRQRSSATEVSFTIESLSVMDFLSCSTTQQLFLTECRRHFCEEAARYLIRLRELRQQHGMDQPLPRQAERELFYTFMSEHSLYPLPLSRHLAKLIRTQLGSKSHRRISDVTSALFSRIMRRVAPLGLMPTVEEEQEEEDSVHSIESASSGQGAGLGTTEAQEAGRALISNAGGLDFCVNPADKVGLSLDLAANEMQRLLTDKVLPSFLEQQDLKALSSTVLLEMQQEWGVANYLTAVSSTVVPPVTTGVAATGGGTATTATTTTDAATPQAGAVGL